MKSKRLSKIIIFTLILALTCAVFATVTCFAEEHVANEIYDTGAKESAETTEQPQEENVFDVFFRYIQNNISEIFSILSFIGSFALMLFYKRGMLPFVKNGVSALSNGVKKLGDAAGDIDGNTEELTRFVNKALENNESILTKMAETLETLEKKLNESNSNSQRNSEFKNVLSAQIDMLYEIFMAASLPQYLKDRVGEQVAAMRVRLAESESENEPLD